MKKYILPLLLLLPCIPSLADIYVTIDENGNKVFSNTPPLNEENVEVIKVDSTKATRMNQDNVNQENNDQFFEELRISQEKAQQATETKKPVISRKQRIEEAEQALKEARQLKPGDYIKNTNGSIRYTEDYFARIKQAEEALEDAKQGQ